MAITVSPLSVFHLVDLLQETIEDNFMQVVVEAEISNLARPASGHLYLTLKDSSAQIRAVMFRGSARVLKFRPEDGQQVICRGRMTVFDPHLADQRRTGSGGCHDRLVGDLDVLHEGVPVSASCTTPRPLGM